MSDMDEGDFERERRTKNENEGGRRRRRVAGEEPENPNFVNKAAENWYVQYRVRKSLIKERALRLPAEFSPFVRETLVHYGWSSSLDVDESRTWFIDEPEVVIVNMVYEFYANLRHGRRILGTQVMVRGIEVDWSEESIHTIYGIPPTAECWYSAMIRDTVDWDELLRELVSPQAVWSYGKTNEPEHFPASWLSRGQHILFLLIISRLMPSTHTSEVTRERAVLLYAMMKRRPISAGQIIRSSIMAAARGVGNRGLVMPSLISSLCLHQQVPFVEGEQTEKPRIAINLSTFRRLANVDPARPQERVPPPPLAPPAPPQQSAPAPGLTPQLEQRLDHMEDQMRGFGLRITHMQAAQQARHRYEDARDDYSFSCWEQMHEMMRLQMDEGQRAAFTLPRRPVPPGRARRGPVVSESDEED